MRQKYLAIKSYEQEKNFFITNKRRDNIFHALLCHTLRT